MPLRVLPLLFCLAFAACSGCVDAPAAEGEGEGEGDSAAEGEGEGEGEGDCAAGSLDCACDAGRCGADLACVDDVCVGCPAGSEGCACADGTCLGGALCDALTSQCRAPTTCDVLGCAAHQLCSDGDGIDAVCLDACEDGFDFADGACTPSPSCDPAAAGFLDCDAHVACLDDVDGVRCEGCEDGFVDVGNGCAADDDCATFCDVGQSCTFTTTAGRASAVCGDCNVGFVPDGVGGCVDRVTCDELLCGLDEVCTDATVDADASCHAVVGCGFGEVDGGNGSCIDCVHCFDDDGNGPVAKAGVVGVGNGGLASGNKCVCELAEGFFQSADDGTVKECDADHDGWVSADLLPLLRLNGGDNPFAREERCTVRTVDRFELVADLPDLAGVSAVSTRVVAVQSIVDRFGLSSSSYEVDSSGTAFVSLYEPEALDSPGLMTARYTDSDPRLRLRNYQGGAALDDDGDGAFTNRFLAAEVNPLTKACNHDADDLNLDSFADVSQSHDDVDGSFATAELEAAPLFYRMAYFVELMVSAYRDRTDECGATSPCHGALLIAEKDRHGELDLGYVDRSADGQSATYWQDCARSRDAAYAGSGSAQKQINMDFAAWHTECDAPTGSCLVRTDIDGDGVDDTDAHVAYDGRAVRERAALADRAIDLTADGDARWPGMNHPSQFKCVSLSSKLASDEAERAPPASADLNACTMSPRTTILPGLASGSNPTDPQMSCIPGASTIADGFNAFAAVVSSADVDDDYDNGCIAEGHEWSHFCAATSGGLSGAVTNLNLMYGQLFCACGDLRSGDRCEIGCAEDQLLSTPTASAVSLVNGEPTLTRTWSCLHPVALTHTLRDAASGLSLVGEIPAQAQPTEVLSAQTTGGTTLTLSAPPLR